MKKNFTVKTVVVFLLFLSIATAQQLPENPMAGRVVFEKQGCISCHSVYGSGGTTGPDFGKKIFSGDDFYLLSKMWNHSSKMFLVMAQTGTKRPSFTGQDVKELSDFLYFVRFLGQPGNISTGRHLFSTKGCARCHSVGRAVPGKVALDSMKIYVSPIHLAEVMWNHSTLMHERGIRKGIRLPSFSDNEFADLTAYIRGASSLKTEDKIYSYPGSPVRGEQLFKSKGCYYCHVEKPIGPTLDRMKADQSVTEIAGAMWNHSGKMASTMKKMGLKYPSFTGDEMADVISYLYFKNLPRAEGSAESGARLFKEKGCENCHVAGNKVDAPTIDKFAHFRNEDEFLAALWNHAPKMEEVLLAHGKKLPELMPNDVKSLYLFIDAKTKEGK